MPETQSSSFNCPNCNAAYRLVRAEGDPHANYREITCRTCGAPLSGREGRFILKYFLVDRPRTQATAARGKRKPHVIRSSE